MKKIKILFIIGAVLIFHSVNVHSQTSYSLNLTNDSLISSTELLFDVYFKNTGSADIKYSAGQYVLNYDEGIKNGGILSLSILPGSSQLNPYQVPDSMKHKVDGDQIQIFGMPPYGVDSALTISMNDSVKIGTFKLKNTNHYSLIPWGFIWKNEGIFHTKIYAYLDSTNSPITDTTRHNINIMNNHVSVSQISEIVTDYSLSQNYPNPFNPETKIKFSVPRNDNVRLVIYDMLGREISTLINEKLSMGVYEYTFNGTSLSSGMYFYKITAGEFTEVRKMILLK